MKCIPLAVWKEKLPEGMGILKVVFEEHLGTSNKKHKNKKHFVLFLQV